MSTSVIESNGKASTETVIPNAKDTLANVLYGGANQGDGPAPTNPSTEKPASTSENGTQSTSDKTVTASSTVEQSETKEPPKGKAEPTELEKQLKSQSDANRRLGQQLSEKSDQLDRALEAVKMLQAKIEGTYEEPAQPTPEQIKAQADFSGREVASARMAVERYGADAVKAAIYTEKGVKSKIEELKAEKPWIANRIFTSELPAMEAMQILEEEKWFSTYGTDPSKWLEKIEAELKPKHLDEFRKQIAVTETGKPGPTVSDVRGAGGTTEKSLSLAERLYGKAS